MNKISFVSKKRGASAIDFRYVALHWVLLVAFFLLLFFFFVPQNNTRIKLKKGWC